MVQQYRHFVAQARRLPDALAAPYRVPTPRWRVHDLGDTYAYARSILTALNRGDSSGNGYSTSVDPLTNLAEVLPPDLQRRLTNTYATIQLADSVARYAIDQAGRIRDNGGAVLAAILNMENDATSLSDDLHTQVAVLNKINGANVLGLRIGEMGNQLAPLSVALRRRVWPGPVLTNRCGAGRLASALRRHRRRRHASNADQRPSSDTSTTVIGRRRARTVRASPARVSRRRHRARRVRCRGHDGRPESPGRCPLRPDEVRAETRPLRLG